MLHINKSKCVYWSVLTGDVGFLTNEIYALVFTLMHRCRVLGVLCKDVSFVFLQF